MTDKTQRMRERIASMASAGGSGDPKYDKLVSELETLKAQMLSSEVGDTPDTAHAQSDIDLVYQSLSKQRVADLIIAYNKQYFIRYSEYTRFVIASALVKLAIDVKKDPAPLWTTLVNSTGRL